MTDINSLIARNTDRWKAAKTTRDFSDVAKGLCAAKSRYQAVAAKTGVPWFVIAVIHEREASQNWNTQLAQGDPLHEVSRHVPSGRGSFQTWEEGAYDALVNCAPHASHWHDWTPGGALTLLEEYNGLAYANHNRPSPYIWAGTTIYDPPTGPGGKVLVDHGPIEDVWPKGYRDAGKPLVDPQLGCAGLILAMQQIDPSISFGSVAVPAPVNVPKGPAKTAGAIASGSAAAAAAHQSGLPWWAIAIAGVAVAVIAYLIIHKLTTKGN